MGKISEELLLALAVKNSGGGGGGTDDYNDLKNQPQINGNTLVGNKSASDLGLVAAETGKGLSTNDYADADKAIVGGVTAALAGKQNALTAGSHIAIDDDTISVNRWAVPAGKVVYTVITSDENYGQNVHVQRHTLGGALIDDRTFLCASYTTVNVDDLISIFNPYSYFNITLLADSDEHQSGYGYTVNPITTPTSNSFTFTLPQEENDNDLIVRSELNAVSSAVSAIKDGTNIDSFAEVETALAGKADLTDLAPAFSTSTAYTVGQYVSYDGNIYKCTSAHSAGAWVAGDFTLVAMASELESKQDKTDNNLQTTDKTTTGAINELKSGLTNLDVALSVPDNSGKNHVDATTFDSYTSDKGITVTPNGTGGIAVSGANSGTGATGVLLMKSGYSIPLKAGITYRFSGNWSGVTQGSTTIRMDLRPSNTLDVLASEATDGIGTYTPSEDINVRIFARVAGSYTIPSDVTMHPVITVLTDTSYTPYIPSVESRIEAVESKMQTDTFSGTTDAYGNISLDNYRYVIAAYSGGYVCIPFEYNYTRYIKILSTTTFEAVANTNVSGGYTYIA